ncbi:hepatic lectin-like [Pimephales promelas]|uniref:hepatic lectin-like n=1 Tax=Pimephales promelas TaxID=90988 RepID=UPI0019559C5C|nr:hepatic lectin-like [Pimephales promelas]
MKTGRYIVNNVNDGTTGSQTESLWEDEEKAQMCRGSRCLVLMTVCLGLICVLLLVFITLYITTRAERDLLKSYKNTVEKFNQTTNTLQDKNTDLMTEKDQLKNNFNSLSQKKPELETREQSQLDAKDLTAENQKMQELESKVTSLSEELKKEKSKQGNPRGPECLFKSSEPMSWSESRQYCRDRGADLVIINTEEKQKRITSFMKERVWIGLSDIENKGIMKWVDNSTLNQTFWFEDRLKPNNEGRNEDCVELMPLDSGMNWNDLPCSAKRKGICEKFGLRP